MVFNNKYLGHNFINKYEVVTSQFRCTRCDILIIYYKDYMMYYNYLLIDSITCDEVIIKKIIE